METLQAVWELRFPLALSRILPQEQTLELGAQGSWLAASSPFLPVPLCSGAATQSMK